MNTGFTKRNANGPFPFAHIHNLFIMIGMQMKTTQSSHLSNQAKLQILMKQCWQSCGEACGLCCCWWGVKWSTSLDETLGITHLSPSVTNASHLSAQQSHLWGSVLQTQLHMCEITHAQSHTWQCCRWWQNTRNNMESGKGEGVNTLWYIYLVESCRGKKWRGKSPCRDV